jgi:hypothetical protein
MNVFREVRNDKVLFRGFAINFFIIFLTFAYILVSFRNLPPFLPIFNQMPWGEARIAETIWIFLIPALSLLIFAFNFLYSGITYQKIPLIPRILVVTSFIVSILALLFVVRTIQIV